MLHQSSASVVMFICALSVTSISPIAYYTSRDLGFQGQSMVVDLVLSHIGSVLSSKARMGQSEH
jgi:FtsH-binding integral membrane protein